MGNINILGSIIYAIIGYLVLIEKSHLGLSVLEFYMFMFFSSLAYLTTQISGIIFRKGNYGVSFMLDLIFSFIPLVIVIISFTQPLNIRSYIADFRLVYLLTSMIDILFFIPICYKFSQLRTGISRLD